MLLHRHEERCLTAAARQKQRCAELLPLARAVTLVPAGLRAESWQLQLGRRSRPAACRSRQERGGSERVRALGLEGSVSRPATYTTHRGHEACGFQHADLTILAKLACALS
jgi:hypothetical protein